MVQHFKQNAAMGRATRLSETSGAVKDGSGSHESQPGSPGSPSSSATAPLLGHDASDHQYGSGKPVHPTRAFPALTTKKRVMLHSDCYTQHAKLQLQHFVVSPDHTWLTAVLSMQ